MQLILRTQRAQDTIEGRAPLIEWKPDDYAVADGNTTVGRIYRSRLPAGVQWQWFLQTAPVAPPPNSGSANSLDGAMAAFKQRYESCRPR